MTVRNSNSNEMFTPTPKIIEVEVPNDAAIFYYKGGIKAAIEQMQGAEHVLLLGGDGDAGGRMTNAITAMKAFLDAVELVASAVIEEYDQWEASQQNTRQRGRKVKESPAVAFVPRLQADDED